MITITKHKNLQEFLIAFFGLVSGSPSLSRVSMFVTVKIGAISGLFVILVILGSSGSI